MAVMLRSIGIPARVAIGFTQGTQHADGTYLINSHDAHAWVEVLFDEDGWVRFDPTPLAGGHGGQQGFADSGRRPRPPRPAPAASAAPGPATRTRPEPAPRAVPRPAPRPRARRRRAGGPARAVVGAGHPDAGRGGRRRPEPRPPAAPEGSAGAGRQRRTWRGRRRMAGNRGPGRRSRHRVEPGGIGAVVREPAGQGRTSVRAGPSATAGSGVGGGTGLVRGRAIPTGRSPAPASGKVRAGGPAAATARSGCCPTGRCAARRWRSNWQHSVPLSPVDRLVPRRCDRPGGGTEHYRGLRGSLIAGKKKGGINLEGIGLRRKRPKERPARTPPAGLRRLTVQKRFDCRARRSACGSALPSGCPRGGRLAAFLSTPLAARAPG